MGDEKPVSENPEEPTLEKDQPENPEEPTLEKDQPENPEEPTLEKDQPENPESHKAPEMEKELEKLKEELALAQEELEKARADIYEKDSALIEAQRLIMEQDRVIKRLGSTPNPYFTVIRKFKAEDESRLLIYADNRFMEVSCPEKDFDKVEIGTTIKMTFGTFQPISIVSQSESVGNISIVRRVFERYAEIEDDTGIRKVVLLGKENPEVGDRVILDTSGIIIQKNLGKDDRRFILSSEVCVDWSDIGGQKEAIDSLIEMVEMPFRYKELFRRYRKSSPKGILLYGPPGCGKTLMGKAVATAIARVYGRSSSTGFLYIKGPEILSKWVGEAEATIRSIFERCREHERKNGYPAVLFIDEADAILGERGRGISSDVERTIVPAFLAEMDGIDRSSAIVLLATNRPDTLDPAVIREGRIDRKVKVDRPDRKSSKDIFSIHLKRKPIADGHGIEEFADLGSKELFSEKRILYRIEKPGKTVKVILGHISSGAMIASIVEKATSYAIKRDIKTGVFKGLTPDNIVSAIDEVHKEHLDISHKGENPLRLASKQ